MRIILLSGGSGKRLWPMSSDYRSKQFLQWLQGPNGNESMVQRVWRQLTEAGLSGAALITASSAQQDYLTRQLGLEVPIRIEPERRDTFAAIALAAAYLYSHEQVHPDEIVVVQPVDTFVEADFFIKVKELESVLLTGSANLALIGVKPTYPSAKYGYIIPVRNGLDAPKDGPLQVGYFKEKPTEKEAEHLIEQHALWNCGVVGFRLSYLLTLLHSMGLPTDYEQLLQQYTQLPFISFDYAVIEKEKHVLVIPYAGDWKDLGTWNTLTEEMSTHILGKGLLSEDSTHTHLMNELNMPIVVLGLPGIVVAASHDGILVADKKASPRLKELLQEQVNNDHMEICRWGSSRKMDHIWMEDGTEVATRRILVLSGESYQLNRNQMSRGVWCIVKGKGKVLLHHTTALTSSGDIWELNAEGHCEIIAETTVEFIETRFGCLPAQEG